MSKYTARVGVIFEVELDSDDLGSVEADEVRRAILKAIPAFRSGEIKLDSGGGVDLFDDDDHWVVHVGSLSLPARGDKIDADRAAEAILGNRGDFSIGRLACSHFSPSGGYKPFGDAIFALAYPVDERCKVYEARICRFGEGVRPLLVLGSHWSEREAAAVLAEFAVRNGYDRYGISYVPGGEQ